jgi:hypothetical protein
VADVICGTCGFDRVNTFGVDQLFDTMNGTSWVTFSTPVIFPGAPGPASGQAAYKWFGPVRATRVFDHQPFWCVGLNVQPFYQTAVTSPFFQQQFLQFSNPGNYILSLEFETDGSIAVISGGNGNNGSGAELGRTTTIFPLGVWSGYLECRVSGFGGAADIQLWLNDVLILHLAGASIGAQIPDRVTFAATADSAYKGTAFDNIYILDGQGAAPWNDRLGPIEISAVSPSSDASGTWNSTVNGSSAVAPIYTSITDLPGVDAHGSPDGDYSYVSPPALNVSQFFTVATPQCYGRILGVMLNQCFRGASGSTSCDAMLIDQAPAVNLGTSVVNGGYHTAQQFVGLSPYSGTWFTAGEVGGSMWGARTASPGLMLTQMYLEIITSLRTTPYDCGANSYSF